MTADPRTIPATTPPDSASESASESESSRRTALSGNAYADGSIPAPEQSQSTGSGHIWLIRLRALLFVTLCATFGVLLMILPWTPKWTDNPLLLGSSGLRELVASGFVRGLASGLGLLDLWLGFREAIFYHENPKSGGHQLRQRT